MCFKEEGLGRFTPYGGNVIMHGQSKSSYFNTGITFFQEKLYVVCAVRLAICRIALVS